LRVTNSVAADKLAFAWNDPSAIADRPTFDPLSAGGMLLGVLVACVGIGSLVGWAAGSLGIGMMIGSLIGIPAAIAAVYRTYGGAL
jgi:F0F1-type ATP synthase assembly protein I